MLRIDQLPFLITIRLSSTISDLISAIFFSVAGSLVSLSLPILCFEAFPPVSEHNRGVASAEQRYLLRIL